MIQTLFFSSDLCAVFLYLTSYTEVGLSPLGSIGNDAHDTNHNAVYSGCLVVPLKIFFQLHRNQLNENVNLEHEILQYW